MKTKLIVRHEINARRFDEKSFFNTILGFSSCWDLKRYDEYLGKKILRLPTIDENHIKSAGIYRSVVNGIRVPILFSFASNKPAG